MEQDIDYKKVLKVLDDFEKLNQFVITMFNDKRIPDRVKNEYNDKYNKLSIHRIDKEVINKSELTIN
jgi:hypothetical protein